MRRGGRKTAELIYPRPSLSGCIVLAVVRNTRGLNLSHHDRFNHFTASPFVSINGMFDGEGCLITNSAEAGNPELVPPVARITVTGPSQNPHLSWNPGPVRAMTVAFYPESWRAITGVDVECLADRPLPAEEVLPPEICAILESVLEQGGCTEGFKCLQDALQPVWQAQRPPQRALPMLLRDWTTALAVRGNGSGLGKSARQIQRRIKSWTGQSQRDLERLARAEEAFVLSIKHRDDPAFDLAQVAAEAGYADQSHMGREVRNFSGAPPARINKLIATEESYWLYRLLGERFS